MVWFIEKTIAGEPKRHQSRTLICHLLARQEAVCGWCNGQQILQFRHVMWLTKILVVLLTDCEGFGINNDVRFVGYRSLLLYDFHFITAWCRFLYWFLLFPLLFDVGSIYCGMLLLLKLDVGSTIVRCWFYHCGMLF